MNPFVLNGDVWRVASVAPGDLRLVDRTGTERIATTDPSTRTVYVISNLKAPLLDKVMMHEVAHAATISYGLLDTLHALIPAYTWVPVEEWVAQTMETHGIEVAEAASQALGRAVCVEGNCHDKSGSN